MNDYKIKVNNEAESREAQELFFELGYKKNGKFTKEDFIDFDGWICALEDGSCDYCPTNSTDKEITLQQLRDIVVLKRNKIEDATHASFDIHNRKGYMTSDGLKYVWNFQNKAWGEKDESYFKYHGLKPISDQQMASHNIEQQELKANPKLFLDPKQNYAEIEWDGTFFKPDYLIEVPNGAVEARINGSGSINFINGNGDYMNNATGGEWVGTHRGKHYIAGHPIVWQRTQDEPFFTPESVVNVMESIASDGISLAPRNSAESIRIQSKIKSELDLEPQGIDATLAERQSTYGDFVHVANTTGKLFAEIKNGKNAHMLPYAHEEALHMICSKIARIVNGDCYHKDSWHDIAGYAKLIENLIKD